MDTSNERSFPFPQNEESTGAFDVFGARGSDRDQESKKRFSEIRRTLSLITEESPITIELCSVSVFLLRERHQYWRSVHVQWPRGHLRHTGSENAEETRLQMSTQHLRSTVCHLLQRIRAKEVATVHGV